MSVSPRRQAAVALVVALASLAGTRAASAQAQAAPRPSDQLTPAQFEALFRARSDSARMYFTTADVHFMTGMIDHHAQALIMAAMAPTHGASPAVRTLCERILNAQQDEIVTMQQWLRERHQPVPEVDIRGLVVLLRFPGDTARMPGMSMGGGEQQMTMPGMLTPEQMAALDRARGTEFDRLFLTGMIQHHGGAISMVRDLFATPGEGRDELAFKLANDIQVDQTTEIARMQLMLAALPLAGASR